MVLLALFLLVEINQVSNTATTTNTVSFSGEGKVSAAPDIAMISASVVTQAVDSKTAQNANSTKSNAISAFLKNQGIADADIQTSGYNVLPQYKYPQYGGQPTISGYEVDETYTIKLRDLTKISTILSGLVTAGANQVNNLGLQIDNPDAVQAQARALAITAAKKKATELESEVGIKLGRIVNFSENSGGITPGPIMYDAKSMGAGSVAPVPSISTGQNEIVSDVTITYQIK